MKFIAFVLLIFIMPITLSVSASDVTIDSGTTRALSSTESLKSNTDVYLSIIRIPALYNSSGDIAYGVQDISFMLHDDAPSSVVVNEITVSKGQTVQFELPANSVGGLDIPIYMEKLGSKGDFDYTITIAVKGAVCPDGYDFADGMCSKTFVIEASDTCPDGFELSTSEGICKQELNEPANVDCPEGSTLKDGVCTEKTYTNAEASCDGIWSDEYEVCFTKFNQYPGEPQCNDSERPYLVEDTDNQRNNHEYLCVSHGRLGSSSAEYGSCDAGYTLHKWGEGKCTDSEGYAVDSTVAQSAPRWCDGYGEEYYDGINYLCVFKEPYIYQAPVTYQCEIGEYIDGNCVDKTSNEPPTYACKNGGAYQEIAWDLHGEPNLNMCEDVKIANDEDVYSCPSGTTLEKMQCVSVSSSDPSYTCPEYYELSEQSCKYSQSTNSKKSCPAGWQLEGGSCFKTEFVEPSTGV
mgnify:CR=1 FL=1